MTPPRKISISRAEKGSFLYMYIYNYRARSRKEKESGLYRRASAVRTADVAVNTCTVHTGIEGRFASLSQLSYQGKIYVFAEPHGKINFPFLFTALFSLRRGSTFGLPNRSLERKILERRDRIRWHDTKSRPCRVFLKCITRRGCSNAAVLFPRRQKTAIIGSRRLMFSPKKDFAM